MDYKKTDRQLFNRFLKRYGFKDVIEFQKSAGLKVTGKVDDKTLDAMDKILQRNAGAPESKLGKTFGLDNIPSAIETRDEAKPQYVPPFQSSDFPSGMDTPTLSLGNMPAGIPQNAVQGQPLQQGSGMLGLNNMPETVAQPAGGRTLQPSDMGQGLIGVPQADTQPIDLQLSSKKGRNLVPGNITALVQKYIPTQEEIRKSNMLNLNRMPQTSARPAAVPTVNLDTMNVQGMPLSTMDTMNVQGMPLNTMDTLTVTPKQYNLGGQLLQTGLQIGGNMLLPGVGTAASALAGNIIEDVQFGKQMNKQMSRLNATTNPYQLENGGPIKPGDIGEYIPDTSLQNQVEQEAKEWKKKGLKGESLELFKQQRLKQLMEFKKSASARKYQSNLNKMQDQMTYKAFPSSQKDFMNLLNKRSGRNNPIKLQLGGIINPFEKKPKPLTPEAIGEYTVSNEDVAKHNYIMKKALELKDNGASREEIWEFMSKTKEKWNEYDKEMSDHKYGKNIKEIKHKVNKYQNYNPRAYQMLPKSSSDYAKLLMKRNKNSGPIKLQLGGSISGSYDNFKYGGPTHEGGGIPVNGKGLPSSKITDKEVEGKEVAIKLKDMPTYIFSTKLKVK